MGLADLLGQKKKRTPVGKKARKKLLEEQDGKCWRCRNSFALMRVRPISHHLSVNAWNSRQSNLVLVCPNCHDRIHQRVRKVRKKTTNRLGLPDYRVRVIKVRKKKKGTRKRRKKRMGQKNPFGFRLA